MLTKLATFRGVSPAGEPLVRLFESGAPLIKEAGALMPEIKQWMAGYKAESGKLAILVNAMGSSEYWGQNVNGDVFPEAALIHDCRNHKDQAHPYDDFTGKIIPPYGYWTFLSAFPFVHHRNKDPSRAFGHVALAAWNPKMHRVELVVIIDKSLAMQHGAQDVVDRIEAGEYPDCSMGCRVPYDVCSVCLNKSKTRNDYCSCVKEIGMGKILDDGRRIGVINFHPRFFDISFVFIGADKTAKVMCKLGSGLVVPQSVADADLLYGPETGIPEEGLLKAASSTIRDIGIGTGAGGLGGALGWGAMELLKHRGKPHPGMLKGLARAAGEWGIAGGTTTGVLSALQKRGGATQGLVTADVEEARFPDVKTERKKLDEAVLERVMGRTEGGKVIDEKTAGLKDLKSITHLFENLAGKPPKGRIGKRPISAANLLGKSAAERPDPTDDADTRLLMGRVDNQESPTAIGDGTVHTNIFHNEGEDSAGVDRSSGFTDAPPWRPRVEPFKKRPKVETLAPQSPHDYRVQWSGDVGGDSTNLSKESFDVERAHKKLVDRKTGLTETFERAKHIKIGPPPTPNRREYPFTGTIEFKGLTIHVENAPGTIRKGKTWQTEMKLPYGEILSTRGTDGDKLDVYVGPWRDAENAYIVHQNFVGGPKDGRYDEDKVMLGFESAEQAKAAYLAHYTNPKFFRSITAMAFPLFKRAILRKEAHGEKLASAWSSVVAGLVMEDELQVRVQEVPSMEKDAADLEELFSSSATARRRQRTWRDKVTGRETNVTGSGMESSDKAKTASVDIETMKVERVLHGGWSLEDLLKVSNETKAAAHLKWADIVKCIGPSKAVGRATPLLSQNEPDLPAEVLNKLGADEDLKKGLATPALMGMMLKPKEFQRIILIHIGKSDLADKLDSADEVFKPSEESAAPCEPLEPDHFDDHLLKTLLPFLEGKSYTGPVVRRRIIRIIAMKPTSHPESKEVDSPLLSKVASAYTWYRKEVMKLARALPATVTSHPELHARTLGVSTEDLFSKTAAGEHALSPRSVAILLGTVPLSLLYAAHKRQQMEKGEDIGLLAALIAEHPWLTSMGVVTGLGALLRGPRARQAVDEAFAAGDRIWRGKQLPASA